METIPHELIAEISLYDVALWRALCVSCKGVWRAMCVLSDFAKMNFTKWFEGNLGKRRWQELPNGWRHGKWIEFVRYTSGCGYNTYHYYNNRLHGDIIHTYEDIIIRRCSAYEGKAHGEWIDWDIETGELMGHVLLDKGKIIKVYKWTYGRYDSGTLISGIPDDSEFVF